MMQLLRRAEFMQKVETEVLGHMCVCVCVRVFTCLFASGIILEISFCFSLPEGKRFKGICSGFFNKFK